jgi:uncharacterized protein YbbC (DUF1343 family)/CubicO group peptidase (beta-lactamase class C family)
MIVNRIFAVLSLLAILLVFFLFPGCKGAPPSKPVAVPALPPPPTPPTPRLAHPPVSEKPPLTLALDPRLSRIDAVARQAIASGGFPGAVILVGHRGKIAYRHAFGYRSLLPQRRRMTTDTIFDLASLTKVIATTTAIMQLVDEGRLRLDDPVGKYWPAFNHNGKRRITIRHLLTHCSGLRPEINPRVHWSGYGGAIVAIADDHPLKTPGTCFKYSDANFIALGEIVHRVSGMPLNVYCKKKIFQPLGLRHTTFLPPASWQPRIAPADIWGDRLRWGEVHDPIANRMGGVAGNAGLFSTADDLAVFVQMLLDGGVSRGKRVLSAKAIAAMTRPYHVPGSSVQRGLGWDIQSPYSKEHNAAFPKGSFGHTGYTGTSIWADPHSETFLIILTNRLHPDGHGQVKPLRARVASSVAAAYHMGPPARVEAWKPLEVAMAGYGQSGTLDQVQPGIEVLASSGFAALKGKRVGVITNHSGIDAARRSTVLLLQQAPQVKLRAIFSPEHGLKGVLDCKVSSGCDDLTGLPVYSLYGKVKKPTRRMLQGLDALVYDIQDVGARYYTYITTMAYAMEAAADAGIEFYVLDRPNPINAAAVQGPVLDSDMKSFIGYYPMPVRYGMTPGEVARLYNREAHIGARLQVVTMKGYRRQDWFDQTGLPWVNPSPNLRSLTQAILYCGVGIVESANVSVGRGTDRPFEILGAPWINGHRLARYLQKRQIPGVEFEPVTFVPKSSRYARKKCQGVRFLLVDRDKFDGPALGVELAVALSHLYPGTFDLGNTLGMIGSREVVRAIKRGDDPREIRRRWQPELSAFLQKRQKYLLY